MNALQRRLEAARIPVEPKRFDPHELENVPAPVRRYLGAVLEPGQPMIAAVDLRHAGTFRADDASERWSSFRSSQRTVTRRPGFVWDALIWMTPGVPIRVHDAYVAGEGILQAKLFGMLPVASTRGTPELAEGELMRFLAESTWYPTALLPSQGVEWKPVDDRAARVTLRDGAASVTLEFRFQEDGLIDTVRAEARGRGVGREVVPTPWLGRFWDYAVRDGARVPLQGEVAWVVEGKAEPYWRGRLTKLRYEFAEVAA
jgi:hypothetical protein